MHFHTRHRGPSPQLVGWGTGFLTAQQRHLRELGTPGPVSADRRAGPAGGSISRSTPDARVHGRGRSRSRSVTLCRGGGQAGSSRRPSIPRQRSFLGASPRRTVLTHSPAGQSPSGAVHGSLTDRHALPPAERRALGEVQHVLPQAPPLSRGQGWGEGRKVRCAGRCAGGLPQLHVSRRSAVAACASAPPPLGLSRAHETRGPS